MPLHMRETFGTIINLTVIGVMLLQISLSLQTSSFLIILCWNFVPNKAIPASNKGSRWITEKKQKKVFTNKTTLYKNFVDNGKGIKYYNKLLESRNEISEAMLIYKNKNISIV